MYKLYAAFQSFTLIVSSNKYILKFVHFQILKLVHLLITSLFFYPRITRITRITRIKQKPSALCLLTSAHFYIFKFSNFQIGTLVTSSN